MAGRKGHWRRREISTSSSFYNLGIKLPTSTERTPWWFSRINQWWKTPIAAEKDQITDSRWSRTGLQIRAGSQLSFIALFEQHLQGRVSLKKQVTICGSSTRKYVLPEKHEELKKLVGKICRRIDSIFLVTEDFLIFSDKAMYETSLLSIHNYRKIIPIRPL